MKEAQVAEIWRLAYKLWLVVVLNICRGIDENIVSTCAELIFAPINSSFANAAPFLPFGFCIIFLGSAIVIGL